MVKKIPKSLVINAINLMYGIDLSLSRTVLIILYFPVYLAVALKMDVLGRKIKFEHKFL